MTDDVERQLDDFYRSLDDPARRVQARWKTPPSATERRTPPLAWFAAAVASAAAAALVVFSLAPRDPQPIDGTAAARPAAPKPALAPPPAPENPRTAPPPAPPPVVPAPKPIAKPVPPEPPAPPAPKPVVAKPSPGPAPAPEKPAPKAAPTRPELPSFVFASTKGSIDLGPRRLRKPGRDIRISEETPVRALSTSRLELAKDRFLLVRARTRLNLVPRGDRLDVVLESGDVLAELRGEGPGIRVVTPTCEVTPLGTIFSVRADRGRTAILVEESRVSCRSGDATVEIPAGYGLAVVRRGELPAPERADFSSLAWTRGHRPAVLTLLAKTFDTIGNWEADADQGAARGRKNPRYGIVTVDLESHPPKPPIFRIPVRGRIVLTCRFERSAKLIVQINNSTQGFNFRYERPITAPGRWRTETIDFADFYGTLEQHRGERLKPGDAIGHFSMQAEYGENMKGFWVRDVRIEAIR